MNDLSPLKPDRGAKHILRNSGFTFIELIMVIVLLGIMGAMGAEFISQAFKGFAGSDRRMEMYEQGALVLARLERELHLSLPNAIRIDGSALEFGLIEERVLAGGAFGRYQENDPAGALALTDETAPPPSGTVISIYNRNWNDFTNPVAQRRLYTVAATAPPAFTLSNTFKPGIIASSPSRRYYPVDQAIRYYAAGNTLMRAAIDVTGEGVNLSSFPAGNPVLHDLQAGSLAFSYAPGTLMRSAVVSIGFTLSKDGEQLNFHKEIQVRNVP